MAAINFDDLTDADKLAILKIKRMELPKHHRSDEINQYFMRFVEQTRKETKTTQIPSNVAQVNTADLAVITLTPRTPNLDPFKPFAPDEYKDFVKNLKKQMKKIPLKELLEVAEIGVSIAEILLVGSNPASAAAIIGLQLLMRVRFGSLFVGGGIAISMVMQNLNKLLNSLDVSELSEQAAHTAAAVSMTIINAVVAKPSDVLLEISGAPSKFFSAFSKTFGILAKHFGFHVAISATEHALHNHQESKQQAITEEASTAPTPFNTRLMPSAAKAAG